MASQGYNLPSSAVDLGNGDGWTNPSNIEAIDSVYANGAVSQSGYAQTGTLRATNFGFSIPGTATINGFYATVGLYASTSGINDSLVKLIYSSSETGSNLAQNTTLSTSSGSSLTYGGSSNLWGGTWTPAEVNDTSFGVDLNYDSTLYSGTVYVDYVYFYVYYTPSGTTYPSSQTASQSFTGAQTKQINKILRLG